jgi:hypothetical protein
MLGKFVFVCGQLLQNANDLKASKLSRVNTNFLRREREREVNLAWISDYESHIIHMTLYYGQITQ